MSQSFAVTGALVLLLASQSASAAAQADAPSPLSEIVQPKQGVLEWHFQGRKLLTYAFATNQLKPYVSELYSLGGENVLRDAPADHLHHHGLMYAIRVNGVNFWEEAGQPGREQHVKLLAHGANRSASGLPQVSFTELIHWLPHYEYPRADSTPAALLVERRTLTLTVDKAKEEVALAWHAEFQVGARTNRITVHGSEYNGLGLRLPAAWDHVARQENSENTRYPAGGKPGTVPARWATVSHTVDGRSMQVALLARPRGHAGTNTFFAMTEPFTYLSATQGLDKAPLEYRAGDRFNLDYLVLVYSAARTPSQIEDRYQAWVRELDSRVQR